MNIKSTKYALTVNSKVPIKKLCAITLMQSTLNMERKNSSFFDKNMKQNANVDKIRAPTIYFIESRYLAPAK